jgi:hypothetical protein
VHNIKRGFQPRITVCRDKTEDLTASKQQILNRLAEHFEEHLSNCAMQPMSAENVFFSLELHILVSTVTEVYHAIRKMKNNRAPGEDAITAELTKENDRCVWKEIYQLTVSLWEKELMPEEWHTAIICPIF